MPEIVLFADQEGGCPVLSTLDGAPSIIQQRCLAQLVARQLLSSTANSSQWREQSIQFFRIGFRGFYSYLLYYIDGLTLVILHAVVSVSELAPEDLAVAIHRKEQFSADPEAHTYGE